MATGLLGMNPYSSGVNLDLSSKATNMAIQQEQKQQAKREATEKYLMDYQKSLNPAGMRHIDAQLYNKNMADAQDYFIKNREQILNPQKYGYDAQATHLANLRDAASLIDESKTQGKYDMENAKEVGRIHQRGDELDQESMDRLHHSLNYDVRDHDRFLSATPLDLNVIKKYNQKEHQDAIYGNLKMPEITSTEDADLPGYKKEVTRGVIPTLADDTKLKTNIIPTIIARGESNYFSDERNRRHIDKELANPQVQEEASKSYEKVMGVAPKTIDQLRQGMYFNMAPNSYKEGKPFQPEPSYDQRRADSMTDKIKMNRITSAQADARSNKAIQAANVNANVNYVRGQMNSWEVPNQHIELNGKNYKIIEPPKAIKDKYANEENDIDPLTTKKVTYKSNPMIVKDPETGEIFSVPQNVDRTTHSVKDSYNGTKMTNITGDFHSRSTSLLVPSDSKGKINEGLSSGAPKGETWAEKQKRLRQK